MAETAAQITNQVAAGIAVLARVASVEADVMPYATFIAGFFPGAASVLAAIAIAQPFINKAIAAAPAVERAVTAGAPILQAIQDHGPQLLTQIKTVYAVFANADPTRPETNLTAAGVSDATAIQFAGPLLLGRPFTQEEQQRVWDKAQGSW